MLKGYRTVIINILMVLVGLTGGSLAPDLAAQYTDAFILLMGAANLGLRAITDSPLFKATHPASTSNGAADTTATPGA